MVPDDLFSLLIQHKVTSYSINVVVFTTGTTSGILVRGASSEGPTGVSCKVFFLGSTGRAAFLNGFILGFSDANRSNTEFETLKAMETHEIGIGISLVKFSQFAFAARRETSLPNHPQFIQFLFSQGNKWCDFCKIFISNNPASIRNHELGTRHKEAVGNRLNTMRKEKAAKEKELKEAASALEKIEAKAQRSYQKDMDRAKEARSTNIQALATHDNGQATTKGSAVSEEWEYDSSSGYYQNQSNGCYYDPNSGFYYTDALGRWVTQEEALAATQASSTSTLKKPLAKAPVSTMGGGSSENKSTDAAQSGPPPGRVVSTHPNPMRSVKGKPSSLIVNKRKRENEKPKVVTKEEAAALKAREAAKKRVEEREKSLLGLYKH